LIGSQISHYKITAKLGEGGMGEVYLAEDTNLMRQVAIKVLPEQLTNDADRLARMQREAQVLAQLSHANVAAIHGLEEHDGRRLLIMEYAEGMTLGQRIRQFGGGLALDEVADIAVQIANGLEAAHAKGIVHRDLKPANVMVADDVSGKARVKLLDFGLAKAYEPDGSPAEMSQELSKSPTMVAATLTGMIMGTAAYMSPEQARGKPIDRRSDVWAFGCVLYEMLTGTKAFEGETVSDTMASILKEEPDYARLPAELPERLRSLLQRCLRKEPDRRLRDIGDVRVAIEDTMEAERSGIGIAAAGAAMDTVAAGTPEGSGATTPAGAPASTPSSLARAVPWAIAAIMTLAAVAAYFAGPEAATTNGAAVRRFTLVAPEEQRIPMYTQVAISPTGTEFIYPAEVDGGVQLYRRGVDRLTPVPIPGTEDAFVGFYSPDGETIGFSTGDRIRRVSRNGGPAVDICSPCAATFGADLAESGAMVYSPNWAAGLELILPDATRRTLTDPDDDGGVSHLFPQFLPGGTHVLFTIWSDDEPSAAIVSIEDGEVNNVADGGFHYRYLPPGTLLSVRDGTLVATPFDLQTMQTARGEVSVQDGVFPFAPDGFAAFDVSPLGTVVFRGGTDGDNQIVELTRGGDWRPVLEEFAQYDSPRYSPDGDTIVYSFGGRNGGYQVATYAPAEHTGSQLTADNDNVRPIFSPDGRSIVFSSARAGGYAFVRIAVDGRGDEEIVFQQGAELEGSYPAPSDWSASANAIAFSIFRPQSGQDLLMLSLADERVTAIAESEASEDNGVFSPDGRWIAYASARQGRAVILAVPIGGGAPRTITPDGRRPQWNADGSEIFFRRGDQLLSVEVEIAEDRIIVGDETVLFEDNRLVAADGSGGGYDVSAAGQTFLMIREPEDFGPFSRQFHVLENLRTLLDATRR